ncbi:MAG: universal stress protein [Candidatus Marinimicrobia bacterium]|nr:universal stress protein [Candidatus Neomarinimicrobiota bacterium]MBL7011083.1 universal stress protein [Candidatus Neomarinimicrobiota bacterium]MBL7031099.1 universal stress protein [Candidatus Neomarinimicrobiota bacterium]
MKFLIAVGSKEFSEPTLRVGLQVAKAFKAAVTIAYVGPKVSEFSSSQVRFTQERMEEWEFDRPGVEVLEWAFNFLAENNYITPTMVETGFPKNTLVQTSGSRSEVYLQGTVCENVNLILRNGDIIAELRDEVQRGGYDVTIIGGSQKRRMAHDLVQYIDSSIFIVNKYDKNKSYNLLLPVDDSMRSPKAVKFGARVAQAFDIKVNLITVSKTDTFGEGYTQASKRATKLMRRAGINHEHRFETGDPVTVIKKAAGNDHIIVMGASTKNPLFKFFTGSKPIKIMEDCQCPVLIVK